MKSQFLFFLALCGIAAQAIAQSNSSPAPAQEKSILIMNAKAHVGNGEVVENCALGMKKGKITLLADARLIRLDMSAYDTVIYADGKHVYPGFIAPNSTLGLVEVDAVRATRDFAEIGTFKPSVRSVIAYNTDSEVIPTVRSNGVLIIQVTPRGGIVSGTSSVVHLDAWNWEDAIVREDDGIHLNWPRMHHKHDDKGKVKIERTKNYDQQLKEITSFFREAAAYLRASSPPVQEIRFEALQGVFKGTQTLYVHADEIKQIQEAISFKKELSIPSMVIIGGYDSWMVPAEVWKQENMAVMLPRVHSLPYFNEDNIQFTYRLPALLFERGIPFCFQNEGDMEAMGTRNLPFHAGTAVAHGLPYEQAVKALTLAPATILGINERCGSLEEGKDATLFISEGDALDMMGNKVTTAFIQGRSIDLRSKQTELYDKYRKKYGVDKN